jgi:hypothetical protein
VRGNGDFAMAESMIEKLHSPFGKESAQVWLIAALVAAGKIGDAHAKLENVTDDEVRAYCLIELLKGNPA